MRPINNNRLIQGAGRWLGLLLFLNMMVACMVPVPAPTPTLPPTPTVDLADNWTPLATGVEFRMERVLPLDSQGFDMYILRLYPAFVEFKVHYRPQNPLGLHDWQSELPDVLAFINGSFFDEYYRALGLVMVDGVVYGYSFVDFGGMFQVESPDILRIRYLVTEPYQGEVYQQAIQAFPMLVAPGGQQARRSDGFNTPARRSIIAQDTSGRILLMSTGLLGEISFAELQYWLLNHPDLSIDSALALDGGRSVMFYAANPNGQAITVPSFDYVPVVLGVYAR